MFGNRAQTNMYKPNKTDAVVDCTGYFERESKKIIKQKKANYVPFSEITVDISDHWNFKLYKYDGSPERTLFYEKKCA